LTSQSKTKKLKSRSHHDFEQRKERLDEEILQNNSRTRNYSKHSTTNSEHYQVS